MGRKFSANRMVAGGAPEAINLEGSLTGALQTRRTGTDGSDDSCE
jgi:hypothetical protein